MKEKELVLRWCIEPESRIVTERHPLTPCMRTRGGSSRCRGTGDEAAPPIYFRTDKSQYLHTYTRTRSRIPGLGKNGEAFVARRRVPPSALQTPNQQYIGDIVKLQQCVLNKAIRNNIVCRCHWNPRQNLRARASHASSRARLGHSERHTYNTVPGLCM